MGLFRRKKREAKEREFPPFGDPPESISLTRTKFEELIEGILDGASDRAMGKPPGTHIIYEVPLDDWPQGIHPAELFAQVMVRSHTRGLMCNSAFNNEFTFVKL